MNKKMMLLPALLLIGIAGYAQIARASENNKHDQMISSLAGKLGVSEDKVTVAFDELHGEREAEMKTREEARLQELVDEGKLTNDQKSAIIAKRQELIARHEAEREELKKWAEDLGIDMSVIGPMGMGHGKFIYKVEK